MEQMKIPQEMKVDIDFERPGIPYTAEVLQPVLFKDTNRYCCILGPDPQAGIFGCGQTPEEALQDWDKQLTQRIEQARPDDKLLLFVNDFLNPGAASKTTGRQPVTYGGDTIITKAGQDEYSDNDVAGDPKSVVAVVKEEVNPRKNTTDQSNADGSEYR